MGLLSNTVSFCQYQVEGALPPADELVSWAGKCLAANAFRSIDNSAEEASLGWVSLDDPLDAEFASQRGFWRRPWLTFAMRQDRRRVPATVLRHHLQRQEAQFLAENPGYSRVPKARREELREALKASLLARSLAVPAIYDAVWDTEQGRVTLCATSARVMEQFEGLFRQSFEGLRLVLRHPFARAAEVVPANLAPALEVANRAASDAVARLISDNTWLGTDLLRWLLARTLTGQSELRVCRPGPAAEGERFIAYLDNRLVAAGGSAEGAQKVTVTGPQDSYREACSALSGGKEISEATILFELGEHQWRTLLKSEMFLFGSFRCPGVRLEKDNLTDEDNEQEALFYERMALLGGGLQLFDSLLAQFLEERLSAEWPRRDQHQRAQLAEAAGEGSEAARRGMG